MTTTVYSNGTLIVPAWLNDVDAATYVKLANVTTISAAAATVLDDASTSAMLTTLGGAPLASPTFTGTPSLPSGTVGVTAAASDNDTSLATTAFVQQELTSQTVKLTGAQTVAGVKTFSSGPTLGTAPFTTPTGSAPLYGCRAWVLFDTTKNSGGGTDSAATNRLILGSGNVTSVLRNAIGDFTITFTTAMPDANYALTGSGKAASASDGVSIWIKDATTPTTTTVQIAVGQTGRSGSNASTTLDSTLVSVAIFR